MATGGQKDNGSSVVNVESLTQKPDNAAIPPEILRMDYESIQLFKEAMKDGVAKIYNIRVMVVGHLGVGKTTLIKRLLEKEVNISEWKSTEGIVVHVHCCNVSQDGSKWTLNEGDSEQNLRLQRLVKVLNDQVQKRNLQPVSQDIQSSSEPDKFPSNKSNEQDVKEMESTAGKISDDPAMEILKLLHAKADKLKQETDIPLTMVDFAGHFAFYTTHQTFLTDRAIYLLVSDVSKHVTDSVTDDCYFDMEGIKLCKVCELVEVWLNSIHSCTPFPGAKTPPVILVGTHVDQIQQDSREAVCHSYFQQIRYEYLGTKPTIVHLADEDFAIDNTVIDQKLDDLKKKIIQLAAEQPYWGEAIPVRWLTLEEHLMNLKAAGVKVIPYSLLEEINQKDAVKIESREELDLFLKFQHDIGNILYFGTDELKEQITLDPQWFIYSLRTIITAEDFILRKIKIPAIIQKWCEFRKTGKLTQGLIDAIWTKESNPECHYNKDLILRLMEKLNIIARPRLFSNNGDEVKEETYFLAPCMLQQETPEEVIIPKLNDHTESSSVLCYVFTGNFLPSPVFHRLVAACIAHWPIAKKKKNQMEENLIFCGCCVFQLDQQHKLTLHFREHSIFLRVTRMGIREKTPSSKLCIEVREFITTNFLKIIGYLGQGLKFEYFIQCPEYNGVSINSLIPVSLLKDNAEVLCDFHDHVIESCKALNFWFEHQEQSGDGDAYPWIPVEILRMDNNSIQMYKKALQDGKEKVYNIRVMVVGQFGVGKTTLTKRLLGQQVDISETKSTEGIDVHKHCCKISLDTGEWIVEHKDFGQLYRLQRLRMLLSLPDQKPDACQEIRQYSEVIYQRMKTLIAPVESINEIGTSTTSGSDQEVQVQLTSSQPAHDVEYSHQETNKVAAPVSERKTSQIETRKDTVKEILYLINANAATLEKDKLKYAALSIWDFAGQYAFYTTHQMFLTSRAIYLLVIDLNQQIKGLIEDDMCFVDINGMKSCKVHELAEIWLNSIHSCAPSPEAGIPNVILVGTHVDKISEKSQKEVIDEYFSELRDMLREKPTYLHLMDDIAIDNTQPDPMLEKLKRRIFELSTQQPHWEEEKPARWLPLEQAIMTLKASGAKIVTLSLIEEINKSGSVRIEDRKELELFLRFHHEIGTILYFSVEGLREKIVLDPQWMIDALKSLITAETFIKKNPAITNKLSEFIKTGKLTHELIDAIWTREDNRELHDNKDHILQLMEQLNIIARPRLSIEKEKEAKEENYFLAPCMLQQATPEEVICPEPNDQIESTPVMCYVFKGKFLPSPIFHRLVAACVAHWPIATKKEDVRENLIFCGCCVFELDQYHKLVLYFREYIIFLRVTKMGIKDKTPSSKLCIGVREFITTNLLKMIGYLGQSLKFEYFIQCPEYNGVSIDSLIPVSRLKEHAKVTCGCHDHKIESCELLGFWFEDQEQSGDGDSYHKVPEVQESYEIKQSVIETRPEIGQGIVGEGKSGEKAEMLSIVPTVGDSEEMLPLWNFTVKDLREAWQAVEDYLLEELAPTEILTFFEMVDLLSAEECEDLRKLKRRQVAETLLQKMKTKLPEAFSSFLSVLNETKQDKIVQGLRQQIKGTQEPRTITHEQETNAMLSNIVYYTLKLELLKDGNILHKTESETRSYYDKGRILFDYNMRSQCLMCETGSIAIRLKPLCKLTKKGLLYFCHNGLEIFVSDLLKRKSVFSSLPEGEMTIHVEVYCDDEGTQFEGKYGQCKEKGQMNLQDSFYVTDDPQIFGKNLSLQYDELVEEIDPLHFKDIFVTRQIMDESFFEELKSLKKRKAMADRFLERVMDEGNTALAALVFALRNNERDDLANNLCTVRESSSLFGDEGLVDDSLIEVVQDVSASHAQESMLYSCDLTATVSKQVDGGERQKRRSQDDQVRPAKRLQSKQKEAQGSTTIYSCIDEIPIEAKRKHYKLCLRLDGLFTENLIENIKQISLSYLDRRTVEKVKNMKQLWSAFEDRRVIDVGKYETLIDILTDAEVRIGIDEIRTATKEIEDFMQSRIQVRSER